MTQLAPLVNIGDILLQEVAQRLLKRLRSADTFARLGGDEFGILLYSIKGIRDATQIADKIQDQLAQPFYINGHTLITSASIGIMINMPEYTSPEEYLRDSDVAMYRAKTKGKARYEIFDQTMRDQVVRRMELENDLRSAIENENIFLYYQPIVQLESRKVSGFEGLLRWHHPEKGNIEPDTFIPIAEDTGLILPLENWVIAEAAKQSFKWQSEFSDLAKPLISINISGKHLVHPDLLPQIKNIIQQYNLGTHSLSIEVTEGDVISDTDTTVAVLRKIRELGVKVQIDDFGTGYSSLSYLHQFPFDIIKIDRSFVHGMLDDTSKIGLIRTIILMAMELKKDVIAEGIETQEELEILISLGCKYGQGHYFSQALNAADATVFLEKALKMRETGGLQRYR